MDKIGRSTGYQPPCPKATIALLRRVEDLLDISIPLAELPEQARAWERHVDELAADDSDVAEYIASLEEREPEEDLPEEWRHFTQLNADYFAKK